MAKCITTKLPESVTDTSLPLAGEMVIQTRYISDSDSLVADNHKITLVSKVAQTLTITDVTAGTGVFTDSTLTENYSAELTVAAQTQTTFYLSNGTYRLHIPNKAAIRFFFAPKTFAAYPFFSLDIASLDGMPLLEQVSGVRNAAGDIASLGGSTALTLLNFTESDLVGDIGALAGAAGMLGVTFNLSSATGDIAVASNWPSLQTFNAQQTNLSGSIAAFAGKTSLVTLNVDQCQGVTGNVSSLSGCTALETLSLGGTQVTGSLSSLAGMTRLLSLFWLRTAGNPASVTGDLSSLAGMTRLASLSLPAYSAITSDADSIGALSGMTGLASLTLSNITGLAGDVADACSGMTALQRLYIENCGSLTGDLASLSDCSSLAYLVAPNSGLSGSISALAGLTALNTVNLRGCTGVTGGEGPVVNDVAKSALAWLSGLAGLETLDLGFTQVGGDVEDLAGCTELKYFYAFALNGLTGDASQLPPKFALLQNTYGVCSFTWSAADARPGTSMRFSVQGAHFGTDLSAMLVNMAACASNPYDTVKAFSVWGTRTGGDSQAVQTLRAAGYNVVINGVAAFQ